MGRPDTNGVIAYPRAADPLATHSLFSVSLAARRTDGTTSREVDKQHRIIPLSRFGDLHVLVGVSSMLACAREAWTPSEIDIKGWVENLGHEGADKRSSIGAPLECWKPHYLMECGTCFDWN